MLKQFLIPLIESRLHALWVLCFREKNVAFNPINVSLLGTTMKSIPWIVSLLVLAPTLWAAEMGLYELSADFHPAKPFRDKIEQAILESRSNDNNSYYLRLGHSGPFSLKKDRIGLVVGDKVIHFFSDRADSPEGEHWLSAIIEDTNLVSQIVQYFKPVVRERRHPGHRMLVTFMPDKDSLVSGEPVTAKLRITNIGDSSFTFMHGGRQRGARDNQFAFSAELAGKMLPDIGDPTHYGGLGGGVTLKPGEHHEIAVDLTKWFAFTQAGTYSLRGSYYMRFMDEHSSVIWEDFACAEFVVRIKN